MAPPARDLTVSAGIGVVGATAAITSWSGLSGLAALCGISETLNFFGAGWVARLAWLVPISIDVYAVTAARVWLRTPGLSARTRSYARANALAAVVASILGNAVYHWLVATGAVPGPVLIVVVGAIAPTMLGLVAHLAALIAEDRRAATSRTPHPHTARHTDAARPRDPGPDEGTGVSRPPGLVDTAETTNSASARDGVSSGEHPTQIAPIAAPAAERISPDVSQDAAEVMRVYWDRERAAGRIPTGAALDRVAGTKDYGRRLRRQWLAAEHTSIHAEADQRIFVPDMRGRDVLHPSREADAAGPEAVRDTDAEGDQIRIEVGFHG